MLDKRVVCNAGCSPFPANQKLPRNRVIPPFDVIHRPFLSIEFISIGNGKPSHVHQFHQIQQVVSFLSRPVLISLDQILPFFVIVPVHVGLFIILCKRIFLFGWDDFVIRRGIRIALDPMPQFQVILPAWVLKRPPFITNFTTPFNLFLLLFTLNLPHELRWHQGMRRTQKSKRFPAHPFWFLQFGPLWFLGFLFYWPIPMLGNPHNILYITHGA
mmetsp:Transcript_11655/g.23379  ORF Transcript_11655/g.23379 Transcript_11655/m.23379 type:complete len:215 (-) Transcript_11655:167-811(-)